MKKPDIEEDRISLGNDAFFMHVLYRGYKNQQKKNVVVNLLEQIKSAMKNPT